MTPETRQRLRELAERATPGPWMLQIAGDNALLCGPDRGGTDVGGAIATIEYIGTDDRAYIAAVSPDVVLELLDAPIDVERLARAIEAADAHTWDLGGAAKWAEAIAAEYAADTGATE